MFKRRTPLTHFQHVRELCWPSMGWRRSFRYVRHRIVRMSDSTHKIAGGLATGIAVAFTPILGTHFIQAALVAWIFRFNIMAALIGTFFCNPWTLPFMWWGAMKIGEFLFSFLGVQALMTLPQHMDFHEFWKLLVNEPVRILLPWLVGGYLLAFLVWPFSYFLFYHLVRSAKNARARIRLSKIKQVAREVTGQES